MEYSVPILDPNPPPLLFYNSSYDRRYKDSRYPLRSVSICWYFLSVFYAYPTVHGEPPWSNVMAAVGVHLPRHALTTALASKIWKRIPAISPSGEINSILYYYYCFSDSRLPRGLFWNIFETTRNWSSSLISSFIILILNQQKGL